MNEPLKEPQERKPIPGVLKGNLRRNFFTGLLVVTPTVVAAWVLYRLFIFVDGLLWDSIRFGWVRPGGIPGVGAISVLALVLLVGFTVNNYLGRRLYTFWESLVVRIPLFNKIYLAVKQIGEALLANDRTVFRAVGMIEYPRRGIWAIVFLTEAPGAEVQTVAGEAVRSVFLPTTPNPTSGFLLVVPEKDLRVLELSVEDGLKMVVSGGTYVPGTATALPPAEKRRWWRFGGGGRRAPATEAEPEDDGGVEGGDEA